MNREDRGEIEKLRVDIDMLKHMVFRLLKHIGVEYGEELPFRDWNLESFAALRPKEQDTIVEPIFESSDYSRDDDFDYYPIGRRLEVLGIKRNEDITD